MAKKSLFPKLSEMQKSILQTIVKKRDSGQHLVRRAHAILLTAECQKDKEVAEQVELCERTVYTWRLRWNRHVERFAAIEAEDKDKKEKEQDLRKFIVGEVLADDPYNGVRGKYTAEQITQLYAIACEKPEDSGRPISHWSYRELADEMAKRGIVERIPITTVWDFLKSGRFKAA